MIKTIIKIALLCLALVVAVCSIVFSVNKITSPPTFDNTNQFVEHLTSETEGFKGLGSINTVFGKLYKISDERSFYWECKLLSDKEYDEISKQLFSDLLPSYHKAVMAKYNSAWTMSDEQQIERVCELLYAMKMSNGERAAYQNKDHKSMMDALNKRVATVKAVDAQIKNTSFTTLANAKEKLAAVKSYDTAPFNRCQELSDGIKKYPQLLEKAHRAYLNKCIDQLLAYQKYVGNPEGYLKLAEDNVAKIHDYDSNASKMYGRTGAVAKELADKNNEYYAQGSAIVGVPEKEEKEESSFDYDAEPYEYFEE